MSDIVNTDKDINLIRNTRKVNRSISFAGFNRSSTMAKDSVYASDIDCIQEFGDKYLIITEIKENGQILRTGQRLLLERLANAWTNSGEGKVAIVMFATHDPALLDVVPVGECHVSKAYLGGTGQWVDKDCNLIDCIKGIGQKYNIKKLM